MADFKKESEAAPIPYHQTDGAITTMDSGKKATQTNERPRSYAEYLQQRDYHPLCCQNTGEDLMIIFACYMFLWSFTIGFYSLLLKAALLTDEDSTALYIFFFLFLSGAGMTYFSVFAASLEKRNATKNEDTIQA